MAPLPSDAWQPFGTLLDQAVTTMLQILEAIKQTAQSVFSFISSLFWTVLEAVKNSYDSIASLFWTAFEATKNGIFIAAHALFTAVLVLLIWILIIYIACLAVYLACRLVRCYRRRSRNRERQPLLYSPGRRVRLPANASRQVSSERRHYDRRTHRDLFRVEIGRRRQDQLRREQIRFPEVRSREDRMRRHRSVIQQRVSRHIQEQHETIITWLHTSPNRSSYPSYGTVAPRPTPPRLETISEPPPPYSRSLIGEPPSYSQVSPQAPPPYS